MSGRPIVHGIRKDAADLTVIKPARRRRRLLPRYTRRAVLRLEAKLKESRIAVVREGIEGGIARGQILERRAHDFCSASFPTLSARHRRKRCRWRLSLA